MMKDYCCDACEEDPNDWNLTHEEHKELMLLIVQNREFGLSLKEELASLQERLTKILRSKDSG